MLPVRATTVLGLVYGLSFAGVGIQLPFFTPAFLDGGFSFAFVGTLWATRSAAQIVSPSVFGLVADRMGSGRGMAILSLLAQAATCALLVFADDERTALLLFALAGLLGGASTSLIDGLTLVALGDARREFGRVRVFGSVGFAAGASLFALVDDAFAPPRQFAFLAAATFALLGAIALGFLPLTARPKLASVVDGLALLKRRDLVLLGLFALLLWASHGAYSSFLTPLGDAVGVGGHGVAQSIVVAIVVEVLVLRASARLLMRHGALKLLTVASFFSLIRWVLLAVTHDPVAFVALQGLHGLSFGLFYPSLVVLVSERVPDAARQTGQGALVTGFLGLGGVVGSALTGVLIQESASFAWGGMAVLSAFALVPLWFCARTRAPVAERSI